MATVGSEVCSEDPPVQDGNIIKYLAEFQRLHLQRPTRCATELFIACIDRAVFYIAFDVRVTPYREKFL